MINLNPSLSVLWHDLFQNSIEYSIAAATQITCWTD